MGYYLFTIDFADGFLFGFRKDYNVWLLYLGFIVFTYGKLGKGIKIFKKEF